MGDYKKNKKGTRSKICVQCGYIGAAFDIPENKKTTTNIGTDLYCCNNDCLDIYTKGITESNTSGMVIEKKRFISSGINLVSNKPNTLELVYAYSPETGMAENCVNCMTNRAYISAAIDSKSDLRFAFCCENCGIQMATKDSVYKTISGSMSLTALPTPPIIQLMLKGYSTEQIYNAIIHVILEVVPEKSENSENSLEIISDRLHKVFSGVWMTFVTKHPEKSELVKEMIEFIGKVVEANKATSKPLLVDNGMYALKPEAFVKWLSRKRKRYSGNESSETEFLQIFDEIFELYERAKINDKRKAKSMLRKTFLPGEQKSFDPKTEDVPKNIVSKELVFNSAQKTIDLDIITLILLFSRDLGHEWGVTIIDSVFSQQHVKSIQSFIDQLTTKIPGMQTLRDGISSIGGKNYKIGEFIQILKDFVYHTVCLKYNPFRELIKALNQLLTEVNEPHKKKMFDDLYLKVGEIHENHNRTPKGVKIFNESDKKCQKTIKTAFQNIGPNLGVILRQMYEYYYGLEHIKDGVQRAKANKSAQLPAQTNRLQRQKVIISDLENAFTSLEEDFGTEIAFVLISNVFSNDLDLKNTAPENKLEIFYKHGTNV